MASSPHRIRRLPFDAVGAFIELIEVRLHFAEVQDLKGKRKLVKSIKDGVRQRFGASVAEIDGHDKWQRSTLLCALVGEGDVSDRADGLVRFVESRCPEGCMVERDLLSLRDIRD